ncbi:MASE1 domain-containing protein [Nodularia sphaerocarpa]|uniref:MASE1 domain-containing protein n=1 Tax=Nodularia sphaerocarpa TaxID=137816 RepID=UPI001EFBFF01|nr:MASE1 domain-containing protein [Nodularia sphaerocarpa]MDB9373779.1 MASE1 domain-containing protein [Nodularia sphaerocarpa CS-585]MDB9376305.1 MASE1 domain-containing protein [Nodularia sphaerocarpa CS-585A2]ULP72913.1 Aerobic respiration control sensor protein ArcB [Nodularia sphaerocarpa UHCC 0038]
MKIFPGLGIDYRNPLWWFRVLIIAMSYYIVAWLVLKKMSVPAFGTPVWPSVGFAIGFLLLWGRSHWFGVFLGATLANNIGFKMILLSGFGAIWTTIGSLISVTLILRLTRTNYPFNQVTNVVIFSLCTLFTGTIFQSLLGSAIVCLGGYEPWNKYLEMSLSWWVGDAIGILVFAPPILTLAKKRPNFAVKSWLNWEMLGTIIILCIVSYFTFIQPQPLEYLLLPPLFWSAFRFGDQITTVLVAIVSSAAAVATSYSLGIFYNAALKSNSIVLLQLFIGVISVTTMVMLAIVTENHKYKLNLKTVNAELEKRVFDRTRDLQASEAKAQELAAKAEAANRAKSAFIANMSHELRSPLNAVIGFSQLMLRAKNLPPDQYENAGIIYRSGDYLLTLINHVLDLSKIEAGKATLNINDFNLYRLLDDLEDMLHLRATNAGLSLIFKRSENLPHYICTDEVKLRQVLINLLSNAIKFTPVGEISLYVFQGDQETTDVFHLHVRVNDTGVGISAAELPKLFEAFTQAEAGKEMQEGTGLGLAISRKFVQLMGGDISVKSEVGKGTTFEFYIQAKLGEATKTNDLEERTQVMGLAADQPIYKILAVDDKKINLQLLVKLLQPLGFEMKEASNGKEAIAIWDEWEPHLIFMDMRMPVMDGYEATKHIKSTTKGNATAVIALTASVLEEEKAIVLSAGCDDFLRKPFAEHTIFDALAKHLGVKYIFAETTFPALDNSGESPLTSKNLTCMSGQWISQLYEAALEANTNLVLELVGEIPETETHLINSLTKLARQFEFEQLVDLTEPLTSNELHE